MNIFSLFNPASYLIPACCGEKEPDNLIWLWAIIWAIVVGYLSTLGHPWWTAGAGTFALWALASMRITEVSKMRELHNAATSNERAVITHYNSGWGITIKDRWTGNVMLWNPYNGDCKWVDRRTGVVTTMSNQQGWRSAFDSLCDVIWGDKDLRPVCVAVEIIQDTDGTTVSQSFITTYKSDEMTYRDYFPELFAFIDGNHGNVLISVISGYAIYRPSIVAVKVNTYIQEFSNEGPL